MKNDVSPVRTRGRPRAFDREAALDKATRLFWAKGYEATSMTELTEAMGIGSPSLYAAFGSKESLFLEALGHYQDRNSHYVWTRFLTAATAREAVLSLLMDSASALTGAVGDIPLGCMVTLSAVGSEGHAGLGEQVKAARAMTLARLTARINQAIADREIPVAVDVTGLARFIQTIQVGMSILARDSVSHAELDLVARIAMAAWDARTSFPAPLDSKIV